MGGDWGPLNARARGLGASVLGTEERRRAAGAASIGDLGSRLSSAGYPPDGGGLPSTADGLDRTVSRVNGWRLGLLDRWAGPLRDRLAVVFEAGDPARLRRLVRGLTEGADAERRGAGLLPTPSLPASILRHLARAGSLEEMAELLSARGHPLADALTGHEVGAVPGDGLFELEMELERASARRAASAARPDPVLRTLVARRIDRANAWTLLTAGEAERTRNPGDLHLPGGDRLPRDRFGTLLGLEEPADRRAALAEVLDGPEADLLAGDAPLAELPERLLAADMRDARDRARRQPLGPWPFLHVCLRCRAEGRALRRAARGASMGAPETTRRPVSLP